MARYTVATKNRFAQLDSDIESDNEAPAPAVTAAAAPPPRVHAVKATATEGVAEYPPRRNAGRAGDARRGGARAPRAAFRDTEEPRKPQAAEEGSGAETSPSAGGAARVARRRRGEGGGMHRGGGAAGAPGDATTAAARSVRFHDRQSGTGRGREMKKGGAGSYNWGRQGTEAGLNGRSPMAGAAAAGTGGSGAETSENEDTLSAPQKSKEASDKQEGAADAAAVEVQRRDRAAEGDEGVTIVGFTEYQRAARMKHATLRQEDEKLIPSSAVRTVDATPLERDGYQKYEREETEEERTARELRLQQHQQSGPSESDIEAEPRPRTYPVLEFTGAFGRGRRGGRGAGGRGGTRGGAGGYSSTTGGNNGRPRAERQVTPAEIPQMNLEDVSAFPTLA